jgi:hypothetical protein
MSDEWYLHFNEPLVITSESRDSGRALMMLTSGTGNAEFAPMAISKTEMPAYPAFIMRSYNIHEQPVLQNGSEAVIQWAGNAPGIGTPDGNTPNCGWYGCRVLQSPNEKVGGGGTRAAFGHGESSPPLFRLAPSPAFLATGLAYAEDGGCAAATPQYVETLVAKAVANTSIVAIGQQSNGCWHLLKWAPGTTGANKKTPAMYPKHFQMIDGRIDLTDGAGVCIAAAANYYPGVVPVGAPGYGCGWYGCRVLRDSGDGGTGYVGAFTWDHGTDNPSVFFLNRPEVTKPFAPPKGDACAALGPWKPYARNTKSPGASLPGGGGWSKMAGSMIAGTAQVCQPGSFWDGPGTAAAQTCYYAECPPGYVRPPVPKGFSGSSTNSDWPNYAQPEVWPDKCPCVKPEQTAGGCCFKINGNCKTYPNMPGVGWFADQDYGGPKPSTTQACQARLESWKGSCANPDIQMSTEASCVPAKYQDPCDGGRAYWEMASKALHAYDTEEEAAAACQQMGAQYAAAHGGVGCDAYLTTPEGKSYIYQINKGATAYYTCDVSLAGKGPHYGAFYGKVKEGIPSQYVGGATGYAVWSNTGLATPDVEGAPGSPLTNTSVDKAKQICRDLPGCVGFQFNNQNPTAIWFKSGPQGWSTHSAPGWTTYVFQGKHTPPPAPPKMDKYGLPGGLVPVPDGQQLVQQCQTASQSMADEAEMNSLKGTMANQWTQLMDEATTLQGNWHDALQELNTLGQAIPLKTWELNNKMHEYRKTYAHLGKMRNNAGLLKQMMEDSKAVQQHANTTYYIWLTVAVAVALAVTRALRK